MKEHSDRIFALLGDLFGGNYDDNWKNAATILHANTQASLLTANGVFQGIKSKSFGRVSLEDGIPTENYTTDQLHPSGGSNTRDFDTMIGAIRAQVGILIIVAPHDVLRKINSLLGGKQLGFLDAGMVAMVELK